MGVKIVAFFMFLFGALGTIMLFMPDIAGFSDPLWSFFKYAIPIGTTFGALYIFFKSPTYQFSR